MFCFKCGAQVDPSSKKCPQCGQDLSPVAETNKSSWGKILAIVITIILLYGVSKLLFSTDPSEIIENQLTSIRGNQLTEAYYSYTSQEFQKSTTLEEFKELIKSSPALSQNKTFSLTSQKIEDDKGTATGLLRGKDDSEAEAEFQLVKEDGKWKIRSIRLQKQSISKAHATGAAKELLLPISDQLKAFHEGNFDKAYTDYTSKSFKETTSLKAFREFVNNFNILKEHKSVEILFSDLENNFGKVVIKLLNNSQATSFNYSLVLEDGQWKILSIETVEKGKEETTGVPEFHSQELLDVIQGELKALKEKDLKKAYDKYTSKEFREGTPFDTFKEFVNANTILLEYSKYNFDNLSVNNNMTLVKGFLISNDNLSIPVEFDLKPEDGEWKIILIQLLQEQPAEKQTSFENNTSSMEYSKILIGDAVKENGLIKEAKRTIPTDAKDIYVNVMINNGRKGSTICLSMTHLDSESQIAPVTTTLTQNGDSVASFVFSSPSSGWPKGKYKLTISSLGKSDQTLLFEII